MKKWFAAAAAASVCLGCAWHFLYDWYPHFLVGLFAPVNESVWEHLKLLFWPVIPAALVLGRLAAMSNHHQEKLEYRWQINMFSELLNAASVAIGDSIPTVLSLEGQAYFALGYRQMSAEISRRENEARAQRQAKKAERTTKIEEA